LGQDAQPVCQRGERRRAECSLVATLDQGEVNRFREFATQARLGFALGVIDDELDHRGNRNGQGDWLRVAQPEPRGPIAKRCSIASYRVFGLTLGDKRPYRVFRHRPKLLGIQWRDVR